MLPGSLWIFLRLHRKPTAGFSREEQKGATGSSAFGLLRNVPKQPAPVFRLTAELPALAGWPAGPNDSRCRCLQCRLLCIYIYIYIYIYMRHMMMHTERAVCNSIWYALGRNLCNPHTQPPNDVRRPPSCMRLTVPVPGGLLPAAEELFASQFSQSEEKMQSTSTRTDPSLKLQEPEGGPFVPNPASLGPPFSLGTSPSAPAQRS